MRTASPGGSSEHSSSMPGLRNSVTVNGSPGLTFISAATRFRRAGSILAFAPPIPAPVTVSHAHGEETPRLPPEAPPAPGARVGGADRRQPVDIELRVGEVLIG